MRVAGGSGGVEQVWQARLRAQERAAHVDAEHQVEALHGSCQRAGKANRTGIVDQDIDAPELRGRLLDRARDRGFVADVDG